MKFMPDSLAIAWREEKIDHPVKINGTDLIPQALQRTTLFDT